MNMFAFVMFLLIMAMNWSLIYSQTEFDPKDKNRKYITVKNRKLAKLLINEKSSHTKYVKVADRSKLNVPCFIFYIIFVLILIAAVVLYCMPEMPCEPIRLPFTRRNSLVLDTYNDKMPYVLASLLCCAQMNVRLLPVVVSGFKKKDQTVGSKIGIGILSLVFLAITGYLLYALIK